MEEIIKRLYVGNDHDVKAAKERGYARLACCKDGPDGHRAMLGYTTLGAPKGKNYLFARKGDHMALNLIDAEDPAMIPEAVLDEGVKFITEQMDKGNKILVHCNAGHSRGPSLAMMYLRSCGELPQGWQQSLHIFKTLYPEYKPGEGMLYRTRTRW